MSLKKVSAGSGYAYLTRQVAAADSTELGRTKLVDYYSARGEAPGRWIGSGLDGLYRVEQAQVVTAKQMKNLFGEGRDPETGHALGRAFRPDAVAGFDLTFSPAKSISALWAIAPPDVAQAITQAHARAVGDALAFLEHHAIYTREGANGVRQVDTRGLIAAAFTHRDSRAGDPDLHTHVAVANKLQTRQGKWLAIYGNILFRHVVAASETYNTAVEYHLRDALGVEFVDRIMAGGKRPVREIDGVDPALCDRWSTRRHDIDDRLEALRGEFAATRGREPSKKETIALAQQANLETRDAKHAPRSEAEQRTQWRAEAIATLGEVGLTGMLATVLRPGRGHSQPVTTQWLTEAAARVVAQLESHQSVWHTWHLCAEAQRHVRGVDVATDQVGDLVDHLVRVATSSLINLAPDDDPVTEPTGLRREDGTSDYRHTGADTFTSQRILDAEQRIIDTAGLCIDPVPDADEVGLALMGVELDGTRLNEGQHALVRALSSDPRQVALALAPAGSGKTTAMRALADTARALGLTPIGVAPSAAAAVVLGEATGMPAETLAKLGHTLTTGGSCGIGANTLVVIDEAGMADTLTLDRVIAACTAAGARVRLIGDDQQLAAVGAGGVLRDIASVHGAARLEEVVRFTDPVEATASVALRGGDGVALGFYLDHDRVHNTGDTETCLADVLQAWQQEQAAGRECLMLAPTRELVARLNDAARTARLTTTASGPEVALSDGNQASRGDTILTRHNDRRLRLSATDWVKNGDRWQLTAVTPDGSLQARHLRTGLRVQLPAAYVAEHVELGYATTVHAAQGSTADVMHGILTGRENRQLLYTMLTRGREGNHLHLILDEASRDDEQFLPGVEEHFTAIEILDRIIDRDGSAVSATTRLAQASRPAAQLHDAAHRYSDAVETATQRLLGPDAQDALEAAGTGPLPWVPGIPAAVRDHAGWSECLSARAERVTRLVGKVSAEDLPALVSRKHGPLTPELRTRVAVWRAAHGVPDDDPSLLGPRTGDLAADRYARWLQRQVNDLCKPAVRRWEERIAAVLGQPDLRDRHTLALAHDLEAIQRSGINAHHLLARAASARRPLPDAHTVEALAFRVQRSVSQERQLGAQPGRGPTHRAGGLGL